MLKHFISAVRLVCSPKEATRTERSEHGKKILIHDGGKSVTLPSLEGQPLPPSMTTLGHQDQPFTVDHVFTGEEDTRTVYKHSIKEIVESTLLGYHGTVISFGTESSRTLRDETDGAIHMAAKQVLRCLRKSKKTSLAANLTIGCSFVAVVDENAHDLLLGYVSDEERGGPRTSLAAQRIQVLKGNIVGATTQEARSGAGVAALLKYGAEMEQRLLQSTYRRDSGTCTHHSVFQLTVAYTQFGSMNTPISGNLAFVDMGAAHPLVSRPNEDATNQQVHSSLFTFADTIMAQTPRTGELNQASLSTFPVDNEMPSVEASTPNGQSVVTQVLKEALGGNCKTLLLSHVPSDPITTSNYPEAYEILRLADRARHIQNSPNKREIAEKALMATYMKELQRKYGKEWQGGKGEQSQVPRNPVKETSHSVSDSTSGSEAKMLISEENKRNAELAASALAAAAMNEDSSDEEDDAATSPASPTKKATKPSIKLKKKQTAKAPKSAELTLLQGLESSSSSSLSAEVPSDVTIEALAAILQHPDRGVPRASHTALQDVRIRKDIGALFSGAAIVRWMVENVAGVEGEEDAERLGQLLLDKGALIHSEESGVFANAETLFYYSAYPPTTNRMLSLEEIQALLAKTKDELPKVNTTEVSVNREPEHEEEEEEYGSRRGTREESTASLENDTNQPDDDAEKYNNKRRSRDQITASPESDTDQPVGDDIAAESLPSVPERSSEENQLTLPAGEILEQEATTCDPSLPEDKEEVENKEQEGDKTESTNTSEPDTAPVDTIPIIQTLENTEDYPHPLHMGVAIGKSGGVIRSLVMMFGVDKQDEHGRTPLMFAALANRRSACSTLIDCGAHIDHCDSSGITAIQVTCYHGHKETLSLLLSKKASLETVDKMGHSILHWCTVPKSPSCLQLVIRTVNHLLHHLPPMDCSRVSGNMVKHTDKRGLSAVHWAIYYNHAEHLRILLRRYEDALQHDSSGRTFMTYAIERSALGCIKVLAAHAPALLTHPDSHSLTPLHHASGKISPEELKLLLSFPVPKGGSPLDLNCMDQYNRTPLHYATYLNRPHNTMLLINGGAQQDVTDIEGRTPLDYAQALEDNSPISAILQGDLSAVSEAESPEAMSVPPSTPTSRACVIL